MPQRIVSLCPSQTELLFTLGLGSRVVGATQWCIHPAEQMAHVVRVGGTKKVNLRKVAALQPDFILCEMEENTPEMVAALEQIAPVFVTRVENVADAVQMILDIGSVTGTAIASHALAEDISSGFAALQQATTTPRRVAYLIWKEPWMAAGPRTYIHDVLAHCGWTNVFAHHSGSRYPSFDLAELQALTPGVVLLSSEPYTFTAAHVAELSALFPEVRLVDGELFSWYGSRMLLALPYLRSLL